MVTCTKCGADNKEDAKFCSSCGIPFGVVKYRKRPRDECFGLPHGGAVFALFFGAILVLWGLTEVFGWEVELGTYVIIIIGILILAGAIYGLTQKKS